jgi:hypothetical protein
MLSAGDLACLAMPETFRQGNLTKALVTTQPGISMARDSLIEFAEPCSSICSASPTGWRDAGTTTLKKLCFHTDLS